MSVPDDRQVAKCTTPISAAPVLSRSANDLCLPRFRCRCWDAKPNTAADGVAGPSRQTAWPAFEAKWTTSGVAGILEDVADKEPS